MDDVDGVVVFQDDANFALGRGAITTTVTFRQVMQGNAGDSYTVTTLLINQSQHMVEFASLVPGGVVCRFISEDERTRVDSFISFVPPPHQKVMPRAPLTEKPLNRREKDAKGLVKAASAAAPAKDGPVVQTLLNALDFLLKHPEVVKDGALMAHLGDKHAALQEAYPNQDLDVDDINYLNQLKALLNDRGEVRGDVKASLMT